MNTKTTTGLITIAAALALAAMMTTISVQQVFAPGGACNSCAKPFAPGQLATSENPANTSTKITLKVFQTFCSRRRYYVSRIND